MSTTFAKLFHELDERYVPTDKLLVPLQKVKPKAAGTGGVADTRPTSGPTKLPTLPTNLPTLPTNLPELPDNLRELVEGLGNRAASPDLEGAIRQLCEWRELSAGEIGALLGRNKQYILVNFLVPMADGGALVRKFPDTKNHPQQAYRAAPKKGRK